MSPFWTAPFFILIIVVGIAVNDHKRDLCEHEGLGKWHYWSQVCEPIRP